MTKISEPKMNRLILDDDLSFWMAPEAPVLGLRDIAIGRDVAVPTTVYLIPGDSASGVMGLLTQFGEFRRQAGSKVGQQVTLNQDGLTFTVETVWDGAIKEPTEPEPIGWENPEEQQGPVFRGSSKGLLLGNYSVTGELWKAIRKGGSFKLGKDGRHGVTGEDTSPSQQNAIRLMEAA